MKYKINIIIFSLISFLSFGQEKNYTELDVSIPTESVTIKGTLLKPYSEKKTSLIILIPGSGPTDRDGNNSMLKNNSLKYLAEGLIAHNISTFRFDKSVLSYSKGDTQKIDSLIFDVFIDEAKTIINYFKKTEAYSKIIVAGHSQGSLVGIIASKNNADGFISLAGAGRTIDEVLIEQIEKQAPILKDETIKILTELKKGNTVNEFNPMLISLFNKQVQPFLMSWIKYNPQTELKKLTIPILIIQGTKDIQVSNLDAELLHRANKNSQLKIIKNMNHLFKEIKGDLSENMGSYSNPNLPIMKELIAIIVTFINEIE
ncbi:MAG: alpha/beta hydrolase [Lutibacter sp.]|uniref:alpha/beta hydrolase family protein n=1 Tax=Lutibacter sp. TaxID=1925666 RepID=UPI00385FED01